MNKQSTLEAQKKKLEGSLLKPTRESLSPTKVPSMARPKSTTHNSRKALINLSKKYNVDQGSTTKETESRNVKLNNLRQSVAVNPLNS